MSTHEPMQAGELAEQLRAASDRLLRLFDQAQRAGESAPELLAEMVQETSTTLEELRVAEEALAEQGVELERYREQLELEHQRYQDLFDLAPDPYLVTDAAGQVIAANHAAGRQFGAAIDRLVGRPIVVLAGADTRRELRTLINAMARGEQTEERVLPLIGAEGQAFEAGIMATTGTTPEGQQVLRWIIRDVSERFEREAQISSLHAEIELLNSLNTLSHVLLDDVTQLELLQRVTRLCAEALPGMHAGVTVGRGTSARTAAASDQLVADLDAMEVELAEGPCMTAMETGAAVKVEDLASDDRWPKFGVAAVERGVASSMGLPLTVRGEVIGALNIYAATPAAFGPREEQLAAMLAEQAAFALANVRLYESSSRLAEQLREALASRGLIEQAKGILMANERC